MKVTCRYSGTTFEVQNFGGVYINAQHPLMDDNVPLAKLFDLAASWSAGQLNKQEARILFVALMKYSGLFKWHTGIQANPDEKTVELNMEPLAKLCNFIAQTVQPKNMTYYDGNAVHFNISILPTYSINELTRNCRSIHGFLETCADAKEAWEDSYKAQGIRKRLEDSEDKLMALIRSPYADPSRKTTYMARWTMIACGIDKTDWEFYFPIFKLRGIEVYSKDIKINNVTYQTTDILDKLYKIMDEQLSQNFSRHSATIAHEVMKHIRNIYERNHKGFKDAIGEEELRYIDMDELRKNTYSLLDDESEQQNMRSIALTSPPQEPKREDFKGTTALMDYLNAKAKWMVACHVARKQIMDQEFMYKFELRQTSKIAKEALDSSHAEEETEEVDPNQLGLDLPEPEDKDAI